MDNMRSLRCTFMVMVGLMVITVITIWNLQGYMAADTVSAMSNENLQLCYDSIVVKSSVNSDNLKLPMIYFVTPTYPRREQFPELMRLGQTLMHVKNLHWIVADDNKNCNPNLISLLKKFEIPMTVLASPMPEAYRKHDKQQVPRGVANRRASLSWIRNNAESGIIYFGDDDNTFDLDLFQEIRRTKKVSMFPVGLIGEFAVSAPVVKEGKVVGFFDSWPANRKFPVDMAGFAVSVEFLKLSPDATMPFKVGYEEDVFLKNLGLRYEDIEPLADNCTKILVWHTQTVNKPIPTLRIVNEDTGTSINELINSISEMGVIKSSQRKGTSLYYTNNNGRITF